MDLATAKLAVQDLFPQFRNTEFRLWQPYDYKGNKFKVQCCIVLGTSVELYGNEYIVDLDTKSISN